MQIKAVLPKSTKALNTRNKKFFTKQDIEDDNNKSRGD